MNTPICEGYWCYGACVGTLKRPLKTLDDLHSIVRASYDAGATSMNPGAPVARIAGTMRETLAEYGIHQEKSSRVGHGIGLDYGELPVPNGFNESLLQSGMTIALHASIPVGVTLSDVCPVTPERPEFLTRFPREPFVAE